MNTNLKANLKANYHTHTVFCDGKDRAEDVVKQAIAFGMTTLGFSGHMDPEIHMDLPAYVKEIRRLQEAYKDQIEILCGIELDNHYPTQVFGKEWDGVSRTTLSGDTLDYWIGSTHFLPLPEGVILSVDNTEEIMKKVCEEYYGGDYYKLCASYYEESAKVVDRTHCDFIGHYDLVTRFNDSMHFVDETDPRYLKPALEALEYLAGKGIPFEVNCGAVNRNRKKEFYPNNYLLKKLHEFGAEILISADAHQKELLLGAFPEAIETVKACGFDHVNQLTKKSGKLEWIQIGL